MLTTLTIAGGVALLLFAVRFLHKGLDRLFGRRLGTWMQRLGQTPTRAFVTGLGISFLAPSSTTISVLAVQSVQAGHLTARQMLMAILAANIGLTLAVQLVALEIDELAPIAILFGVGLFLFTRRSGPRGVGQIVLSLGFLLMAIGIMRTAAVEANLGANEDLRQLAELAQRYPVLLAALVAIVAVLLQSSTATIALVIGLASGGVVTLGTAAVAVLGANVGMALTTTIVGWRQIESRRLGAANLLLKTSVAVVGIAGVVWLLPESLDPDAASIGFWTAQMHTGFNVIVAVVGVLVAAPVSRLMEIAIPDARTERQRPFGPKFIATGSIIGTSIALGQSLREIMHLSEIVRSMLEDAWTALRDSDAELARHASARDDQVDLLDGRIKMFLTRLVKEEIDEDAATEQLRQLRFLSELETIGDIVDKNLCELVLKRIRLKAEFSADGMQELEEFYDRVIQNFDIADTVFTTHDRALAKRLVRNKEQLNALEIELRDRHFRRLNEGTVSSHETSAIHLDLLTHLKRINSCLAHVGYAVIQAAEGRDA